MEKRVIEIRLKNGNSLIADENDVESIILSERCLYPALGYTVTYPKEVFISSSPKLIKDAQYE